MKHKFYIDTKTYRLRQDKSYLQITGWYLNGADEEVTFQAELNGAPASLKQKRLARPDVVQRFSRWNPAQDCGFSVKLYLDSQTPVNNFTLFAQDSQGRVQLLRLNPRQLAKIADDRSIRYHLDRTQVVGSKLMVWGWAETSLPEETVQFSLTDSQGSPVDFQLEQVFRNDVREAELLESDDPMCGFAVSFPFTRGACYQLMLQDSQKTITLPLNTGKILRSQRRRSIKTFLVLCLRNLTFRNLIRGIPFLLRHGPRGLRDRLVARSTSRGIPYAQWYEAHKVTEEELEAQRAAVLDYRPKISIAVPTYRTPIPFLREMIDSVRSQTYPNWELCLGDGSEGDDELVAVLKEYAAQDERIKYQVLEKNLGIAGNTNGALALATGDFVGLLDHDDLLPPNALFEIVRALNEDDYDVLYTDEDKVTGDQLEHDDPNFKPDFNPDLLRSQNYITHFFVVRKSIVDAVGGFRSEFDGSQDYDFIFRCTEQAKKIKHIPKILYHWRVHSASTASGVSAKPYTLAAARRAIAAHLERVGLEGKVQNSSTPSTYRVRYTIQGQPLISILIPTCDHWETLKRCLNSILKRSTYHNYEIILIENNSKDPATFDYYRTLEKESRIRLVRWEGPFNYSAINNFGFQYAKGEYVLLLNNDVEIITPDWLQEMLMFAQRDDVGGVGAMLYYPSNKIQHAGVILGIGGVAGHAHKYFPKGDYGFMSRATVAQDLSAVTAACMMMPRRVFEQVHGLDETFEVAFNDVDLCMRIRQAGYLIVWTPYAELYHYESESRGAEDTPEKQQRFQGEVLRFQARWGAELAQGDPYYNPNLTLLREDMTLREPEEEAAGSR